MGGEREKVEGGVRCKVEGGGGVLTQWRDGIPPLSRCSGDPEPSRLELSLYNSDALEDFNCN